MPSFLFIILISLPLLISSTTTTTTTTTTTNPPTAYEALELYNFPAGLLPLGVTGYTLDQTTGEFEVYLPETCKYTVQGYDLRYKSTISGTISKDKLTKLKGISVKVLLLWVSIVEVTRDGDELYLSVGLLSASFDISGFIESPQCGCGFDCNGLGFGLESVEVEDDGTTKTIPNAVRCGI